MPTGHASLMPALRRVVLVGTRADRTDGQLLAAFVTDRDADAFAPLVRRHGPMVLGVCRRVIGDSTCRGRLSGRRSWCWRGGRRPCGRASRSATGFTESRTARR